jgi:hypothetical protein
VVRAEAQDLLELGDRAGLVAGVADGCIATARFTFSSAS